MDGNGSERWVMNPATGEPIPPREQPGYYPGYSTLRQAEFWDEVTRKLVLDRVHNIPPIRFFSPEELRTMNAVCERMLPQDDRDDRHKIPIVPHIDERLHEGRGDGYRYQRMPPDPEAYRLGLKGIDAIAEHLFDRPFVELGTLEQDRVLKTLHDSDPPAGEDIWERMPPHRFFMLVLKDVCEVYYAHPYAWDEIGFGGPAYPRGYMRLEDGEPEPWEVEERRHEWEPSDTSMPIVYEPIGGAAEHHGPPGQGGTH